MVPLPGVCAIVRAASPELMALPHVVENINTFLDYAALFTIERASATGYLRLLQRVISLSPDNIHRPGVLAAALDQAARYGRMQIVQWLTARYWPEDTLCVARAMEQAARHGHLPVMEWLSINCPQDGRDAQREHRVERRSRAVQNDDAQDTQARRWLPRRRAVRNATRRSVHTRAAPLEHQGLHRRARNRRYVALQSVRQSREAVVVGTGGTSS